MELYVSHFALESMPILGIQGDEFVIMLVLSSADPQASRADKGFACFIMLVGGKGNWDYFTGE